MVKVLRALWLIARQSSFLMNLIELAAAAAIVYGIYLQWGRSIAWIAGGVAGLLKAFELDIDRPDQGPGADR